MLDNRVGKGLGREVLELRGNCCWRGGRADSTAPDDVVLNIAGTFSHRDEEGHGATAAAGTLVAGFLTFSSLKLFSIFYPFL